ncbi:HAD family hydrolase [Tenacibaculum crassostreae]|uniref:HAD family hydrolase n=1 Tax=Tenacibaculum crassostreae TaxID=502683 RepID=UPI003892F7E4
MKSKYVVFDLDDTLMYEIDFLKSAYKEIAKYVDSENREELGNKMFDWYTHGYNVFNLIEKEYSNFSVNQLLTIYRNHFPDLNLKEEVKEVFEYCKLKGYKLGLVTDGRSITQRNKLKALEIDNVFDKLIISEEFGTTKPNERNFKVFIEDQIEEYYYIADNPKKDFIAPNRLGWKTICLLDKGKNIHTQNFNVKDEFLPKIKIKSIIELKPYL